MKKTSILLLAALALTLGGAGQAKAAYQLGVDFNSTPFDFGTSVWNLGFSFTANTNATVTALGNADLQQNGFGGFGPQQVGLWDSQGNLLASTFVSSSDPLTGLWRFHAITPVALVAGQTYVVGGQGGADYAGVTPVTVDSRITYGQDLYTFVGTSNSPLVEPTSTEGYDSPSAAGWFGGNIAFDTTTTTAPEPGSLTLLGIGVAGMAGYAWRRRKQQPAKA